MRRVIITLAIGLVLAGASGAQDRVALVGARLIDGRGGPPRDGMVLVLARGRIQAVSTGPAPAGVPTVDCRNKTIIPGLISNHSHVGITDGVAPSPANYNRSNVLRQLEQWEAYGVTTVLSLALNRPLLYELRAQLHAGTVAGADLFGGDRGMGVPSGGPPTKLIPTADDQLDRPVSAEAARESVRAAKQRGTDLIKLWLDDFRGKFPPMRQEIYRAIIEEAHHLGLRVAAHVYDLADAKAVVEAGADILAHGVRDRAVDRDFIRALKQRSIWYIPTLALDETGYVFGDQPAWWQQPVFLNSLQPALKTQLNDNAWMAKYRANPDAPALRAAVRTNQRNLKVLFDAGVRIGFGCDSGANALRIPGFMEHQELKLMVAAGLTPLEAITVATRNAARLIGLEDRGVLAPGYRADLVVLDGDPSADIAQVDRIAAVWHRGRKVSGPITAFAAR